MENSKKTIIGFDLDGVIIDHTALKIRLAKKWGFKLKPEETPSEKIKQVLPLAILRELQKLLYDDKKISLLPPPMKGAKTALAKIKKQNIPCFLISRRKNPELAINLLRKNNLWPEYFNARNAFFVPEPEDKNTKALTLGITDYVDDELKVLEKLVNVKNKFLFDRFGVFQDTRIYTRVNSWPALITSLEIQKIN